MIAFSFFVSFIQGNLHDVVNVLFSSTNSAIELCMQIAGILCMWNGFMKVAEKCGFLKSISKGIKPLINFLFPEICDDNEVCGYIGMNMTANMLGLGNVATPIGLKAFEKLQEKNSCKDVISNSMLMFVVLNMASIQLIPTTVIALRANNNSQNPTSIIIPTIISSIVSVIVGVIIVKVKSRYKRGVK